MVAVDTNVLVRLLTRDDEPQYRASRQLFSHESIYIPDTVVLETEWVLRFAYELGPTEVCEALRAVFGLGNVMLADAESMSRALVWHESGMDFADALHLALSQGQAALKTFDTQFVRRAKGLGKCPVEKL
ncbi:MAG: type II toxin-antitoxin system VapC family toxin [Gammaproteobacteria bacterium]|nr:type II toxin-antitoxin system VapC family toxin [Gammaproteobacteria bacterium]